GFQQVHRRWIRRTGTRHDPELHQGTCVRTKSWFGGGSAAELRLIRIAGKVVHQRIASGEWCGRIVVENQFGTSGNAGEVDDNVRTLRRRQQQVVLQRRANRVAARIELHTELRGRIVQNDWEWSETTFIADLNDSRTRFV